MDKNSAIFLAVMVIVFTGMIALANISSSFTCSLYGKETERETKYSMFGECYVKTEKGWRQRSELRVED